MSSSGFWQLISESDTRLCTTRTTHPLTPRDPRHEPTFSETILLESSSGLFPCRSETLLQSKSKSLNIMLKRQKGDEANNDLKPGLAYQTVSIDGEDVEGGINKEHDGPPPIQETHMRSILKGLTWRFVASLTTMSIAWYITGKVQLALEIGFIEVFAKVAIYYVHERLWANIRM
ncbi:hypothetical protein MHU86_11714 [Fragilaria crotonensis]|nr:hypothetical protein MHU86_11714 [Fragilaria crotonensis]